MVIKYPTIVSNLKLAFTDSHAACNFLAKGTDMKNKLDLFFITMHLKLTISVIPHEMESSSKNFHKIF